MSTVQEQKRALLEQKALDELARRIARESYLKVLEVAERLNVGRDKVESIPAEILPYVDLGTGVYSQRRYHPADVLAADARLRAWKAAQDRGEGEAFLQELRDELEARDRAALEIARQATSAA